jgi:hypothetical protein
MSLRTATVSVATVLVSLTTATLGFVVVLSSRRIAPASVGILLARVSEECVEQGAAGFFALADAVGDANAVVAAARHA